jgi:hypothetical protein
MFSRLRVFAAPNKSAPPSNAGGAGRQKLGGDGRVDVGPSSEGDAPPARETPHRQEQQQQPHDEKETQQLRQQLKQYEMRVGVDKQNIKLLQAQVKLLEDASARSGHAATKMPRR